MTGGLVANVAAASGQGVPAPAPEHRACRPGFRCPWPRSGSTRLALARSTSRRSSTRRGSAVARHDDVTGRLGLHGRIDTQMVYGRKVVSLVRERQVEPGGNPEPNRQPLPERGHRLGAERAAGATAAPRQPTDAVVVSVPSAWLYVRSRTAWSAAAAYFSVTPPSCPSCRKPRLRLRGAPRRRRGRPGHNAVAPVDAAPSRVAPSSPSAAVHRAPLPVGWDKRFWL